MAKKTYRVLSLDYDYFQKVSVETMQMCYPDGLDAPSSLSAMIWSTHYANRDTEKALNGVSINQDEIELCKKILTGISLATDRSAPILIANSHRHIYDFITDRMDESGCTRLALTNADMHHDMFNNNERLDCGNWVKHITEKYPTNFRWIANKVSAEMYGFDDETSEYKGALQKLVGTTLADANDMPYDAVFLCRSDQWLPPHLDDEFGKLVDFIKDNFENVLVEKDIMKPREYIEAALQHREFMEKSMQEFQSRHAHTGQTQENTQSVTEEAEGFDDNTEAEMESSDVSLD